MLTIYDLKSEHLHDPRGIDAKHPRFSWKLRSDKRGVKQTAYHITAYSSKELIWDSGAVQSGECLNIRYAGQPLQSRQIVEWTVSVTATDESGEEETAVSRKAWFEMGLLGPEDWEARWIEPEIEVDYDARKKVPCLRRSFSVREGLKQARIYQTAHGLYEFWINGLRGTADVFKPGLTSYYQRIQYQTYDITGLLHTGENVWAVELGDGWWRGVTGGTVKNNFGYKLHFLGQLELYYEDGSREVIGSDESFRWSTGGLLASDMLMGEIYDAAAEPSGWKEPGFDDSGWSNVHLAHEHTDATLIASRSVPVQEKEEFHPQVFQDASGRTILDFGQNIAGYVRMKLHGLRPGQKVRLLHGEDIDADGNFSQENVCHTPMPLDVFQEITYRAKGGEVEEYCPHFSVFGFRYVLLEGYSGAIQDGDFTAVAVYSDLEETGNFHCSNPLIDRLVANSRWSQKGNFLDVAVDCPTRERNSWTGDAQIYCFTASLFMDVYPFFEKWLADQALEQYASGKVGITFPSTSSHHNEAELLRVKGNNAHMTLAGPAGNGSIGEDSVGWGDSAVWIPYQMYRAYGDRHILEQQYEAAKRWLEYSLNCAKEPNPRYADTPAYHTRTFDVLDAEFIYDTKFHYGEWKEPLPPSKETIEFFQSGKSAVEWVAFMAQYGKPIVATAYNKRSCDNVAYMAEMLGRPEDAAKYRELSQKIKTIYNKYFISENGEIEPGHQAAYVCALAFDLCDENHRPQVIAQLIKEIEAANYHLNTGFLSTGLLLPTLCDIGRSDLAFRVLEQTDAPGWLHPITLGATTMLESWDGMDKHKESYNHYSFGAVCEFLFSYVAGIRVGFDAPGYRCFQLVPTLGGSLTHAEAEFESPYGKIVSAWERSEMGFVYRCEIPVNTTADLTLPDGRTCKLASGQYKFEGALL